MYVDENGRTLLCQAPGCTEPAKFRRWIPPRARGPESGTCYDVNFRGLPCRARPRNSQDLACRDHVTDWTHGPISADDLEDQMDEEDAWIAKENAWLFG